MNTLPYRGQEAKPVLPGRSKTLNSDHSSEVKIAAARKRERKSPSASSSTGVSDEERSSTDDISPASALPDNPLTSRASSDSGLPTSSDDDSALSERERRQNSGRRQWQRRTVAERDLHRSLQQQRADDLAAHLYNAHALKVRARQPVHLRTVESWQHKRQWVKGKLWCPAWRWTAWPLPPDRVPLPHESFGVPNHQKLDGIAGGSKRVVVKELEDVLVSVVYRRARKRWDARDWQSDGIGLEDGAMDDAKTKHREERSPVDPGPLSQTERDANSRPGNDTGIPVFTADDDFVDSLVRPEVELLLAQFDRLLLALHRSRQNHFTASKKQDVSDRDDDHRYTALPAMSMAQEVDTISKGQGGLVTTATTSNPSTTATAAITRKKIGRPRKALAVAPSVVTSLEPAAESVDTDDLGGVKRGRRRIRRRFPKPLEGESYYMMRRRIAEQTSAAPLSTHESSPATYRQPLASSAPSEDTADIAGRSASSGRSRSVPRRRREARDWSEILGTAALLGWDPTSVHTAAHRCSRLFGEDMEFNFQPGLPRQGSGLARNSKQSDNMVSNIRISAAEYGLSDKWSRPSGDREGRSEAGPASDLSRNGGKNDSMATGEAGEDNYSNSIGEPSAKRQKIEKM